MAKALQCPSCGRKHPVATLPNTATFPCSGCGQSLKVPAQFRQPIGPSAGAVHGAAAVAPAPAPVRERTPRPAAAPPPAPPSPDGTAVLPVARAQPRPRRPEPVPGPAPQRGPSPERPATLRRLGGMPLRLLAWLIAIGLGGVITVYVARKSGWLSGQRLVDVFTGTGINRYLRVIAIVPVWAVITTILVTLMVEGSRWLVRARERAHAERAAAVAPGD